MTGSPIPHASRAAALIAFASGLFFAAAAWATTYVFVLRAHDPVLGDGAYPFVMSLLGGGLIATPPAAIGFLAALFAQPKIIIADRSRVVSLAAACGSLTFCAVLGLWVFRQTPEFLVVGAGVAALMGFLAFWLGFRVGLLHQADPNSLCPYCRYDMASLSSSQCPECGRDLAAT